MLDYVTELAAQQTVVERIVVVHADLGRVEWAGTKELAAEQAAHYGHRFEVVARPQGDLLDHIEARGMFPDSKNRYCTSDHKTGQVLKVMTRLVAELGRPARILNCLGIRADESPARAKKVPFESDRKASNGKRRVDRWYPIFDWTEAQVWARVKRSGVRHHPAYDLGMPRLSCCFCVLAGKHSLVLAAKHNPELAGAYLGVEERTGHKFRNDLSMAEIVRLAAA
jgi:3'-phosphoadenosine 5'-phosphosulfate sulfotransferase (PAPS reductase)/FAD synthetase